MCTSPNYPGKDSKLILICFKSIPHSFQCSYKYAACSSSDYPLTFAVIISWCVSICMAISKYRCMMCPLEFRRLFERLLVSIILELLCIFSSHVGALLKKWKDFKGRKTLRDWIINLPLGDTWWIWFPRLEKEKEKKNAGLAFLLPLQNCKCVDPWISVNPTAASQGKETQRSLVFDAKHWPRERARDLWAPQLSLQQMLLTQISRSTLANQRYERQFYVGRETCNLASFL